MALMLTVLVMSVGIVVHAPASAHAQGDAARTKAHSAQPSIVRGSGDLGLPAPVVEMRQAMLEAVASGRIEDLRVAIELNELKPMIGDHVAADPIAALKAISKDGEGRDILAALGGILAAGWVAVPAGADVENNRIYIWPHFVETGIGGLTGENRAEFDRVVPAEERASMLAAGRYASWHLGIGADGTWHFLRR